MKNSSHLLKMSKAFFLFFLFAGIFPLILKIDILWVHFFFRSCWPAFKHKSMLFCAKKYSLQSYILFWRPQKSKKCCLHFEWSTKHKSLLKRLETQKHFAIEMTFYVPKSHVYKHFVRFVLVFNKKECSLIHRHTTKGSLSDG